MKDLIIGAETKTVGGVLRQAVNLAKREAEEIEFLEEKEKVMMNNNDISVNIEFDISDFDREQHRKLTKIVTLFGELGITFDTSYGCEDDGSKVRDWQWDWSLKGPMKVKYMANQPKEEKVTKHDKIELLKSWMGGLCWGKNRM